MNHFETLGVDQSFSINEIKTVYRKLAMQFHPDRNPGGEEQFKAISSAYAWIEKNHQPIPKAPKPDTVYAYSTAARTDHSTYDLIYRILPNRPDDNGVYQVKIPHTVIDMTTKVFFMININGGAVEFRVILPIGTNIPYTIQTEDLPALGSITIRFSTGIDKY